MKEFVERHDARIQRFLEILPGTLAWTIILFPLWGAFFMPRIVAYFTVGFLVFWFYRSFQAAFLGLAGYIKIKQAEKINWYQQYLKDKDQNSLAWEEIKHLIIIPNYNESVEKLSKTLDCLVKQKYLNKEQMMVVLAMEGRAEGSRQRAKELAKKFKGQFGQLITSIHPDGIKGEIRGKASNEAWAAKLAKKVLVDKKGYDMNKITITSCDADSCFHPKYFSSLTNEFALNKKRYLRFWQSPIVWHNFLQTFFDNWGEVEVEPIFHPTSIDAPEGANYFGSLKNRYLQCRRHAWGCTDIPFAIKLALKHPEIPVWTKFFRIYKIVETHLIWSTNWFILTLGAWLPALVNPVFKQTALGYNLPRISRIILTACLVFLFIIIALDFSLRPKKPKDFPRWKTAFEYLQWVLMPVATLLMSVIPGLHSQTQLMTGKRLEYWGTA